MKRFKSLLLKMPVPPEDTRNGVKVRKVPETYWCLDWPRIAFKQLEMDSTYSSVISEYQEGEVVSFDPSH
jgi:hypothetical protein